MRKERVPDIICLKCKHLDTERIGGCKAFPGEVPDIILSGQYDHSFPLKGQIGEYVFTPVEEPVKIWRTIERSARRIKRINKEPAFK